MVTSKDVRARQSSIKIGYLVQPREGQAIDQFGVSFGRAAHGLGGGRGFESHPGLTFCLFFTGEIEEEEEEEDGWKKRAKKASSYRRK
uniref:Uncharacterized protein n=1 Tax=Globodera rostochiensis TaxID=31243 RepID=A0A914GR89_GLORO